MEDNPLVSIITPVLNSIKYIETCLQNVLDQSYPNIEHILVDGGSTDGTLDLLAGYREKYPGRIRFVSRPDNGVGEALNTGFRMAEGKIFGWIDTDDTYQPDTIATAVDFFRANPDAFFLFGGCNMINDYGELIGTIPTRDFNRQDAINDGYHLVFCAAFYRREVIDRVGLMNPLGNDFDFYLRVSEVYQMHRIDKILSNWRLHSDSISGSGGARQAGIRRAKLWEDYHLGRRHGASIFSPRSRRYFRFLVLDTLHLYPLIFKVYPVVRKVLGMK